MEFMRKAEESEIRFRKIIQDTQAGYFFIDREGIIRDVNHAWIKMYKYSSPDEVIGHHFMEIQRFEDAVKATAFLHRILNGEKEYLSGEYTRRCKDDSIGYHSFSAKPVMEGNEPIGIEGFIIDTTQQRRAESERDQTLSRLSSVFDKMVEGFALHEIICDDNGVPVDYRFLDINPAFAKLTGLKACEIIGKTARQVIPGIEPIWIEKYGKVALTGQPETFENYAAAQKSHFRVVAFSNQIGQFATIFEDITEKVEAEKKMITLAHAIDSIKECVSMTDTDNTIIFVNRAFCNTYGYSREELIGRNISMVRSAKADGESSIDEILAGALAGGWVGEAMNCRKDGSDFPVNISTAIVPDENGHPVALIGIATDITERKKNEEELISAKERAEESDRLKSAFLANISHEIRTPMNSILGFTNLLEEMVEDPKQLEYLKIVSTGGERLLNIINSVIDIAKIEAGQVDFLPTDFDVNLLVHELYELNKRRNIRIEFICETYNTEPVIIHTDKTKLFQILNNLLSNALKFTKAGSVRFGYLFGSDHLTFYVKDTGIGIPAEFKTKVFERFQKVELNDRADYEGTGLGLAITRELVAILSGELWFESLPGLGTSFFIRLPLV
jgi:PAS domain S-box-containing protein